MQKDSGDPDTIVGDDDAPAVPFAQCFVFYGDGKLRANANGRKRFGERFRRAGFDIEKNSSSRRGASAA